MKNAFRVIIVIGLLLSLFICIRYSNWDSGVFAATITDIEAADSKSPALNSLDIRPASDIKGSLFINEVKREDNNKNQDGWVELFNSSNSPINLKGFYLSNETANLKNWQFPDAEIGPGELLLIWIPAGQNRHPFNSLIANFKTSPVETSIILTHPDGNTVIDMLNTKDIPSGQSYGRYPDGSSNFKFFSSPTIDYSNNNVDLTNAPGKPGIAITWDDDSIDEWYNLLSFTWYQGIRTTFCLTQPHRLTKDKWEKMRELKRQGHEIASHGYNHENSLYYIWKYGLKAYIDKELLYSIELMTSQGLPPVSFAYPYGVRDKVTDSVLLDYFKVVRTSCYSRDGDPFTWGSTKLIPSNGMDYNYDYSLEDYYKWLKRAKDNNQVVVLYGHIPTPESSGNYRTPHKRLESIINKAKELNLTFYTLSDLSADIGTLKVEFSAGVLNKPEWTLDRKTWNPGGKAMVLPVGEYTIMFRNVSRQPNQTVRIEKGKINTVTITE